jgi:hypothetical protein
MKDFACEALDAHLGNKSRLEKRVVELNKELIETRKVLNRVRDVFNRHVNDAHADLEWLAKQIDELATLP